MKNKTSRILAAILCSTILLAGCSKTEEVPNNTNDTANTQSKTQDIENNDNKTEKTNDIKSGTIIDLDVSDALNSFMYGWDSYSKEYKDDNDEYNSKASPIEDFSYNKSEDNPGTYSVSYVGDSETVVVPSRINGVLVWELVGVPKCVKNLTIPDTVESVQCYEASGVEKVEYSGTIIESTNDIFEGSPFRENSTHDGEFIFGNALIKYTGDAEEYKIPEEVISITDQAITDRNLKLKKLILPTTLKYIESLDFVDTVEDVEVNSQIEHISFGWSDGTTFYLNKIDENVYSFGNVLVYCKDDDATKDIVIPANINRVAGCCFLGRANSLRFESEEDVIFAKDAFETDSIDAFEAKKLYFPKNTTNLLIYASSLNLRDTEELILPEKLQYLNGSLLDRAPSYNEALPNTIKIYTCPNENPPSERYTSYGSVRSVTGLKSQTYIDEMENNGAIVVLVAIGSTGAT